MDLKKLLIVLFVFLSTFSSLNANVICKPGNFCEQDIRCKTKYTHDEIQDIKLFESLYFLPEKYIKKIIY